jgi:RNA polymerase sigma-70 factor (ECF subfamily)
MTEINLADMVTRWSNVFRAWQAEGGAAAAARHELLLRYHEAVLRYLRAELRDEHAAGQVYSDFALRVLEADRLLGHADPGRGRFRDYLKAVLRHMVADHYRRQREGRRREPLNPGDDRDPAGPGAPGPGEDERVLSCWRQELVNRAWEALAQAEQGAGQPYAALLRLQEERPGLRSAELAEQLGARLGRPFTAAGVRQLVHRGRELFGDLLVAEVARSLEADAATPEGADRVEGELIELGLLFSYCKAALERRRRPG